MSKWKILGVVTTIIGAVVSVASDIIGEKTTEETIEAKVNEALAKRESEEEF